MLSCPNKNLDSWKKLVNEVGDFEAFKAYMQRNDGSIPTVGEVMLLKSLETSAQDKTSKRALISEKLKAELPAAIVDRLTIVDNVPLDIIGREDLFLSMKNILEENNVTDPLLINWAGINKDLLGNIRTITSEEQLTAIVQKRYNQKLKTDKYVEFKTNPLALESFNKWVEALKEYPIVFQDIMLGHAIKHLINPNRRSKYVLQLSKVALTNAYGLLVNKPNEANRLGKLYDIEVTSSLSDALEHEPSASGVGYWVHIPRTEDNGINLGFDSYADFEKSKKDDIERMKRYIAEEEKSKDPVLYETLKKELEDLLNKETKLGSQEPNIDRVDADKYGFQDYDYVRVESTYSRWDRGNKPHVEVLGENYEGYYIHGYNVRYSEVPSTRIIPITKEQAEELWKKEVESYPKSAFELEDRQKIFSLEAQISNLEPEVIQNRMDDYNNRLKELEQELKDVTEDNWETKRVSEFKKNVDLLRKLSPSTWCTATSMTAHYVENYDNYLLIVNGVTMAGIEVYPGETNDDKIKEINQDIETYRTGVISKDPESKNWIIRYSNPNWAVNYAFTEKDAQRLIEREIEVLEKKLNKKRQVKEVTSRANNGTASIDYLDDTIAFFEKHNLDLENRTIQNAINARNKGNKDSDYIDDDPFGDEAEFQLGIQEELDRRERYNIDMYNGEFENDPPYVQEGWGDQDWEQAEEARMQEIDAVVAMNIMQEVRENLDLAVKYFNYLNEDLRNDQDLATTAVLSDPHNIAHVPNNAPFYTNLAILAVRAQPHVFNYLSDEGKNIPGLREIYDEYNQDVIDLPFSKTKDNLIQGYYDAKNDKVVLVAANTSVDEASKVAIHEVAHRGMLRMAKDLGGVEQLNQALLNSEKELMKKVPELLKRTGHVTVDELVRDYGFERNSKEGRMKLLMELAARWAETLVDKPKPTWWKQLLKDIGAWISQFTGAVLNEKEVNELVGGFVQYGTLDEQNEPNVDALPTEQEQNTAISKNIINTIAEQLTLNLNVGLQSITAEEARKIDPNWSGEAAFYLNGQVYIVDGAMTLDNVFHEFSHPLFDAIYADNKKLFDKLYADTIATAEGADIVEKVKQAYPDYDENSDMFKKEVMVRTLTTEALNQTLNKPSSKSFKDLIKNILFNIKQLFRKLFGKSIKIEKLDVNTSLKDLAKMLKGDMFNIDTEITSPKDVAQYSRDITKYIESFDKVQDTEISQAVRNFYDITLKQIRELQNSKNIDEIRKVLMNDQGIGILSSINFSLGLTPEVNKQLAKFADDIKKRQENSSNFIHAILQVELFVKKIQEQIVEIEKITDPKEKISSLNHYSNLVDNWRRFLQETSQQLFDAGMDQSSELGSTFTNIIGRIDQASRQIIKAYGPGVISVLRDTLEPINNDLEVYFGEYIADLEAKYAKKPSEKLKKLIEDTKEQWNSFKITDDKLIDLISGRYGDTNVFSAYAEAFTNSPDPIVGGFAVFLKNTYNKVNAQHQRDVNDLTNALKKELTAAGYSRTNFAELGRELTFIDESTYYNIETGEPTVVKKHTLLNQFKNTDAVLSKMDYEYAKAIEEGNQEEADRILKEQKKHKRDYFYQKYTAKFYQREDIYDSFDRHDDLKTLTYQILGIDPATATKDQKEQARKYYADMALETYKRKHTILNQINKNKSLLYDEEMHEEIAEQMDLLWKEYGHIASLTDLNGDPKEGDDKLIAAIEKKYRKESAEFYEWTPRENAFEIALDRYEQLMLDSGILKDSDEFKEKRANWIKKNTVLAYTKDFYNERNRILTRLKELMLRVPKAVRDQIDATDEMEQLLGIATGFRDQDGQIMGNDMSEKTINKVRDLQEAIADKRSSMAGLSGLTREEQNRMGALYHKIVQRQGLTQDEQFELDSLISKKDQLGLDKATKGEMQRLYGELSDLQSKEATDYYVDILNNWLEKMGEPTVDNETAENILDSGKLQGLFTKSPEFKAWFLENHLEKEYFDKDNKVYETGFERMFIWNRTRPNNPDHYEKIKLTTGEEIQGKPTLAYYSRNVKDEISDLEDLKAKPNLSENEKERLNELLQKEAAGTLVSYKTKKIVGKTVDNRGAWLPKTVADGAKPDSPYINEEYEKLKRDKPALFKVLQTITEYHLKWQEDAPRESKLYLEIPRFRTHNIENVMAVKKNASKLKQWWLNLKSFFVKRADDPERGDMNFDPGVLARAEVVDEDRRKIPIQGIYNLDPNEVSMDILDGLVRYRHGVLHQAALIEADPIAKALEAMLGEEKMLKGKYKNKQEYTSVWDSLKKTFNITKKLKKQSTRAKAIHNLYEREFEGRVQTVEFVNKFPVIQKTRQAISKLTSIAIFGGFGLNAIKNKIAAQEQSLIEAAGGRYLSLRSLTKGKIRAWAMLAEHSTQLYQTKTRSLNVQMMQIFDPGQDVYEHTAKTWFSRTAITDVADLSILMAPRKFLQLKATLDIMNGMLCHQKIKQTINGVTKEIEYADAFELKNGQIELKDGIDKEWAPGGKKFNAFKNRMHEVSNRLEGTYARMDQAELNRNFFFQVIIFLKKFFGSMAANHFAGRRLSAHLGGLSTGNYANMIYIIKAMAKYGVGYTMHMKKEERAAVRKITMQIATIAAMYILQEVVFGFDPDEDKDKAWAKVNRRSGDLFSKNYKLQGFISNQYLTLLMGVLTETETWSNPIVFVNTVKGIPDPGALFDHGIILPLKIIDDTWNLVWGNKEAYYKQDSGPYSFQKADRPKVISDLARMFGITGAGPDPIRKNLKNIIQFQREFKISK